MCSCRSLPADLHWNIIGSGFALRLSSLRLTTSATVNGKEPLGRSREAVGQQVRQKLADVGLGRKIKPEAQPLHRFARHVEKRQPALLDQLLRQHADALSPTFGMKSVLGQ